VGCLTLQLPVLRDKVRAIARRVYGADDVHLLPLAEERIARFAEQGLGELPICMAKTHLSLSDDPTLLNAPTGFTVHVRDVRAHTGAGWLMPLYGEIMTMPGWGERPPPSTSTSTSTGARLVSSNRWNAGSAGIAAGFAAP